MRYVALLRGINVGVKNPRVAMSDLKACMEAAGYTDVTTYINSGNVLFSAPQQDAAKLTAQVEAILTRTLGYKARVVVCSHKTLRSIVQNAPAGFGTQPDLYRSDVIFLMPPLTSAEAFSKIMLREDVDTAAAGKGVLYFARLTSRAAQSKLSKIISMPMYQDMTIRSWSTTTKLLTLLDAAEGQSK